MTQSGFFISWDWGISEGIGRCDSVRQFCTLSKSCATLLCLAVWYSVTLLRHLSKRWPFLQIFAGDNGRRGKSVSGGQCMSCVMVQYFTGEETHTSRETKKDVRLLFLKLLGGGVC